MQCRVNSIDIMECEHPRETKIDSGTRGLEPDIRAKITAKQIRGKRPLLGVISRLAKSVRYFTGCS